MVAPIPVLRYSYSVKESPPLAPLGERGSLSKKPHLTLLSGLGYGSKPALNQEAAENLNRPITTSEIEAVIENYRCSEALVQMALHCNITLMTMYARF